MNPTDYLLSLLKRVKTQVQMLDIGKTPVAEAIYAKVMSKKFRKLKVDAAAVTVSKRAIQLAVQKKQPVTISILFGGNKLWRFAEAPEIDWAELFSLIYFIDWMKGIASVYKYGAKLDYYSQDISVESLNNVPRSETNQYSETFRDLLKFLQPDLPSGVKVTYRRHFEEFKDPRQYHEELEAAKKLILKENNGNLPVLTSTQIAATELNVKLKSGQSDDPQWREKVELEHQAIFRTPTLSKYLNDPMLIPACPTFYPGLIATGSTKRSYAKFWAAVGALKKEDGGYVELVLTPKQLAQAKFGWEKVKIPGLVGKNFAQIRVLEN